MLRYGGSVCSGIGGSVCSGISTENAIYIWRRKFGGMEPNQVSELKRIMQENARLKKIVAERDLEIEVMKEIAAKKW